MVVWLLYWLFCYGFDFNILLALSCAKLQKRALNLHWGKATACSCISAVFCTTSSGVYKKNFTQYELNFNEARTLVVSLSPSSSQRRHDCLCRQAVSWEPFSFENAETQHQRGEQASRALLTLPRTRHTNKACPRCHVATSKTNSGSCQLLIRAQGWSIVSGVSREVSC